MPNEQENSPSTTNDNTSQSFDDGASNPAPERSFAPDSPAPAPFAAPSEVEPSTAAVIGRQDAPSVSFQQQQVESSTPLENTPDPVALAAAPAVFSADGGLNVAPKKSKKKLIIGVVVGAIALLIGLSAAAYALWYQNPDRVIGDALGNALTSESAKTDTMLKVTNQAGGETSSYDVKLKTVNNLKDARADISVSSDAAGADFDVSGSLVVKANEKFFVKIDKLKEMLEKSGMQAYLGSSASVTALIDKLDSNWVVITKEEIEENTGSKDDASTCIENVMNKLRTDDDYSADVKKLYQKYPLVTVKQKLGSKDGSLGYEIEFNRENAVKLADGINGTKFYKDMKKCDDKIKDLNGSDMFKESDSKNDDKVKVVVWIDRWSHQFTKLELTGTADDSTMNMTTNMEFDTPVKVDEPKDPITIDELKSDIEAIQQEMMQANEATMQAREGSAREVMRLNEEMNTKGASSRT